MWGGVAVTRRLDAPGAVTRGHRDCDSSAEASVGTLVPAHHAAQHARPGVCLVTHAPGKSDFWPHVEVVYRLVCQVLPTRRRWEALKVKISV